MKISEFNAVIEDSKKYRTMAIFGYGSNREVYLLANEKKDRLGRTTSRDFLKLRFRSISGIPLTFIIEKMVQQWVYSSDTDTKGKGLEYGHQTVELKPNHKQYQAMYKILDTLYPKDPILYCA
jgi:hypothetical protein